MIRLTRHARGLLAAVAVLALTAGVAFAGRADPSADRCPTRPPTGLDRAADASGTTVPVAAPAAGADQRRGPGRGRRRGRAGRGRGH